MKCVGWNSRSINAILVNIQSLYPKQDTIVPYMQIKKTDMAFIMKTWITKKEELQLITSQLKFSGYNIITENKITRKEGLACICKEDFAVEK